MALFSKKSVPVIPITPTGQELLDEFHTAVEAIGVDADERSRIVSDRLTALEAESSVLRELQAKLATVS